MILTSPFIIGSRLLPALRIADGSISLEHCGRRGGQRMVFRWFIDIPAGEFSADDFKSGCGGCSTQEAFGSFLSFLGAADSYQYSGRHGENADMFPLPVVEWAYQHSDEISMLACEIEETKNLIRE